MPFQDPDSSPYSSCYVPQILRTRWQSAECNILLKLSFLILTIFEPPFIPPTNVDSSAVTNLGHQKGEEFSERGPNFLNYVQHIFQGGQKIF